MKLEDIIAKLEQIEQQAALTLAEHPHGHTLERQRLILAISRQLKSTLDDQLRDASRPRLVA